MFDGFSHAWDEDAPDRHDVRPVIANLLRAYRFGLPLPEPAMPRDVQGLVAYIHAHLFHEGLCVKTIKRGCALNDRTASSRFRRHVGRSISSYLTFHRVEAAKCLLRHDELSITEVSMAVGYARPQTLTMAFRRVTGMTPSAYRAQGKKKGP